ncbi:hypothetical protein WN51_01507 [Melipona quadrifasciata]|uniref:Uncharacterized protein n=1 Tax=Melipona quadrifasciata TaxID=166423 RepID=A0A0N1ITE8_9HYME|nr:hypothetical protein WN51_01507 [Melipona quadrifasciata]
MHTHDFDVKNLNAKVFCKCVIRITVHPGKRPQRDHKDAKPPRESTRRLARVQAYHRAATNLESCVGGRLEPSVSYEFFSLSSLLVYVRRPINMASPLGPPWRQLPFAIDAVAVLAKIVCPMQPITKKQSDGSLEKPDVLQSVKREADKTIVDRAANLIHVKQSHPICRDFHHRLQLGFQLENRSVYVYGPNLQVASVIFIAVQVISTEKEEEATTFSVSEPFVKLNLLPLINRNIRAKLDNLFCNSLNSTMNDLEATFENELFEPFILKVA